MTRTILSIVTAFLAVTTVFASAAEACLSCEHVPVVVRGSLTSDTATRYTKKRFYARSIAKAKAVTSLQEAVEWLDRSFVKAKAVVGDASAQVLFESIPDTRIMEGAPRLAVVSGIVDHTAHHRGSLAVYARLIGKEPPMHYG